MIVNVLCVFLAGVSFTPGRMDRISLRYSHILPHQLYNRYDFWDLRTKPDDSRNTHYTVIARLMLIPMLSQMNDTLDTISGYLFTGVLYEALGNLNKGQPPITMKELLFSSWKR